MTITVTLTRKEQAVPVQLLPPSPATDLSSAINFPRSPSLAEDRQSLLLTRHHVVHRTRIFQPKGPGHASYYIL